MVLDKLDTTIPIAPVVTAKVVVRNRELDLVRISASVYEAPKEAILDGLAPMSIQTWDMEQWNRDKTTSDSTDLSLINDPAPNSIEVHPEAFDNVSTEQTIRFVFTHLTGPVDTSLLRLRLEAEDVSGNIAVLLGP